VLWGRVSSTSALIPLQNLGPSSGTHFVLRVSFAILPKANSKSETKTNANQKPDDGDDMVTYRGVRIRR
jgi:hypothetical protein